MSSLPIKSTAYLSFWQSLCSLHTRLLANPEPGLESGRKRYYFAYRWENLCRVWGKGEEIHLKVPAEAPHRE
jgi:hypothetical protein